MNDGGWAFPLPAANFGPSGDMAFAEVGMTLRDYFAAKAMAAFIADTEIRKTISEKIRGTGLDGENVLAEMSYIQADAMLKARGE